MSEPSAKTIRAYFEDYKCGCVSGYVERKKDLRGYCGQHGQSRRQVWPVTMTPLEADSASWELQRKAKP